MSSQPNGRCMYALGSGEIQTITYVDPDGVVRCAWTSETLYDTNTFGHDQKPIGRKKDLTITEYIKKNPDAIYMTCEAADKLCMEAQDKTYIGPFEEISEDSYYEKLNCLPPQKWETVNGVNIFRIQEYMTDNITMHVVSYNGKYFQAYRRDTTPYDKIAEEIKAIK